MNNLKLIELVENFILIDRKYKYNKTSYISMSRFLVIFQIIYYTEENKLYFNNDIKYLTDSKRLYISDYTKEYFNKFASGYKGILSKITVDQKSEAIIHFILNQHKGFSIWDIDDMIMNTALIQGIIKSEDKLLSKELLEEYKVYFKNNKEELYELNN